MGFGYFLLVSPMSSASVVLMMSTSRQRGWEPRRDLSAEEVMAVVGQLTGFLMRCLDLMMGWERERGGSLIEGLARHGGWPQGMSPPGGSNRYRHGSLLDLVEGGVFSRRGAVKVATVRMLSTEKSIQPGGERWPTKSSSETSFRVFFTRSMSAIWLDDGNEKINGAGTCQTVNLDSQSIWAATARPCML